MKVALAFLPRVRLNKILVSFVLNQRLFSFLFVLCVLDFYFLYLLFSFLLKCFIVFEDSISSVLTLKRTPLCGLNLHKKCLRDQGILVT